MNRRSFLLATLSAFFMPRPVTRQAASTMLREDILRDYQRYIVPRSNLLATGEPSNIVRIVPLTDEARRISKLYDEMVAAQQHRQIL